MTESSQVWSVARKYLSPFGRLCRIESRLEAGIPDVYYVLRGVPGWFECKIVPESGRCPDHMSREQILWAIEEVTAGGRWHLLAKRGKEWLLYDAMRARAWFDGGANAPLIAQTGRFPLKEVLGYIAPLGGKHGNS